MSDTITTVEGRELLKTVKDEWQFLNRDEFEKIMTIFYWAVDRAEKEMLVDKDDESCEAPAIYGGKKRKAYGAPHWVAVENDEMEITGYYCSNCDLPMETEEQTDYCPNCGAKMKKSEEEWERKCWG